jgi:hypothetical protein
VRTLSTESMLCEARNNGCIRRFQAPVTCALRRDDGFSGRPSRPLGERPAGVGTWSLAGAGTRCARRPKLPTLGAVAGPDAGQRMRAEIGRCRSSSFAVVPSETERSPQPRWALSRAVRSCRPPPAQKWGVAQLAEACWPVIRAARSSGGKNDGGVGPQLNSPWAPPNTVALERAQFDQLPRQPKGGALR